MDTPTYLFTLCEVAAELLEHGHGPAAGIVLDLRYGSGLSKSPELEAQLEAELEAQLEQPKPRGSPAKRRKRTNGALAPVSSINTGEEAPSLFESRIISVMPDAEGPVDASYMLEALDLPKLPKVRSKVSNAFMSLRQKGKVQRVGRGQYALA